MRATVVMYALASLPGARPPTCRCPPPDKVRLRRSTPAKIMSSDFVQVLPLAVEGQTDPCTGRIGDSTGKKSWCSKTAAQLNPSITVNARSYPTPYERHSGPLFLSLPVAVKEARELSRCTWRSRARPCIPGTHTNLLCHPPSQTQRRTATQGTFWQIRQTTCRPPKERQRSMFPPGRDSG